jgi:hypothetical protein
MGGMLDSLLGTSAPDTSGINQAAVANSQISQEALDWAKQQYADQAPARQAAIDEAMKQSQLQDSIAQQNADISKDYYDYSKETFRPLEQGIVQQAQDYASPDRREQAAGDAIAGVNTQMDNANAAMRAKAAANGVDLTSGNYLAQERAAAVQGAAAAAAAGNSARNLVDTQGFAREMDAASLGRNLSSSQATSAGVALNAGNSAVNSAQVPVQVDQSGTNQVQNGIAQALQGNASAGSLFGSAAGVDAATRGQDLNFYSSIINGSKGSSGASGLSAMSDENVKSDTGKPINTAQALGAIVATPVDTGWRYDPEKGGPDDGGARHDGPMAQDVKATMGEHVAPGGKKIDLVSMNGMLMAGIQQLAKDVSALKKSRSGTSMASKGVRA